MNSLKIKSMKTNKFSGKGLLMVLALSIVLLSSCSDDNGNGPSPNTGEVMFGVNLGIDGTEYLVNTDNLMEGKITAVGRGVETHSFGMAIPVGKFLYLFNGNENTIDQMEMTATGYVKITSISAATILPNGSRNVSEVEPGKLLFTNWPNADNEVTYAFISIPSFTVESYGTFDAPKLGNYEPVELGGPGIVSNNKIYFGTMYSNRVTWDTFPDSLVTLVYDYPSFTNPTFLTSTATLGATSSYMPHSMVKDEQGDIYQVNIRSKHWYNMGTAEDKPTLISKISNGSYDDSYVFDVSEKYSETISLIGMQYVGHGIAYGRLGNEDATNEWGVFSNGNNTSVVKIDLYNKTITNMDLPLSPLRFGLMAVHNGKVYWPVAPVGGKAHIYEIDPSGGADAFKEGAELEGSNFRLNGIYVHPLDQ
ncbi:hypothetical protein [Arthrospiribacter ruber]|uniref:DUF4374 domain-containing protein n=1 Tax=Arthrospiribacter ruber TaxID=2487934 RepID=A0A951J274_9BACT|nr:hypothetical protein [Arthrospiribacter ruber]MBW3469568.1 hypothetical protein [Arthrospiribacter ruber]